MPEVLRTERASFEYAWTEDDFLRCLRQRNCIGMVAEHGRPRRRVHDLRAAQDAAAHPELRRPPGAPADRDRRADGRQADRQAVQPPAAEDHAGGARAEPARPSCSSAAHDFRATQVLRNYYEDSGEDAFQMEYRARPTSRSTSSTVPGQPDRPVRGKLSIARVTWVSHGQAIADERCGRKHWWRAATRRGAGRRDGRSAAGWGCRVPRPPEAPVVFRLPREGGG